MIDETVRHAGRYGIRAELIRADWRAIRDRVFSRLDHDSDETLAARRRSGVDMCLGEARFVGRRVLEVEGESIHAEPIAFDDRDSHTVEAGGRDHVAGSRSDDTKS